MARIKVRQPRGTRLTLRHAEFLQADGTLYTENLRERQGDRYLHLPGRRGRGMAAAVHLSRFPLRRVDRPQRPPHPSHPDRTGLVQRPRTTGDFNCSHPLVNQLQSNIQWGQRGNFLDVPTDCPQRDERLGWSADAQVFTPTALFNFDSTAFLRKYCHDLRDGQRADGAFPDVAPDVLSESDPETRRRTGSGTATPPGAMPGSSFPGSSTSDPAISPSWRENYDAMLRWIDYQEKTSDGLIRPDTNYGDWVATEAVRSNWAPTPCDLLGTAHFAWSTALTAGIADLLGKEKDAVKLRRLHGRILKAFNREYVAPSGRLAGDTQTAYSMALAFNLLPEKLRPAAVTHLRRTIRKARPPPLHRLCGHTAALPHPYPPRSPRHRLPSPAQRGLPFLADAGAQRRHHHVGALEQLDTRGRLRSGQHEFIQPLRLRCSGRLALPGCRGPGSGRSRLSKSSTSDPGPGGGLTRASAWHETPYGRAESAWRITGSKVVCTALVPANTTARIVLPARTRKSVQVAGPAHVTLRKDAAGFRAELCPGRWRFTLSDPILTPAP